VFELAVAVRAAILIPCVIGWVRVTKERPSPAAPSRTEPMAAEVAA
jgi:hypothetical protein